jgi:hypothetical protein
MSKLKRRELRAHMRAQAKRDFSRGGATPAGVTDPVAKKFPELIGELQPTLVRLGLLYMARQVLRRGDAIVVGSKNQLRLPIEIDHLDVSSSITVPCPRQENMDVEEGEPEDTVRWMDTNSATLAQALGHLKLLDEGIARDVARRAAWRQFCDYLMRVSDGDLDATVGDILAKARRSKRRKGAAA